MSKKQDKITERVSLSGSDRTVVVGIVESVAAVTGRDPLDLPPIVEVIDCDALETLFFEPDPSLFVSFEYAGASVELRRGGDLVVSLIDA
ncbi:hypothetical protein KTS45_10905 [Halomicroarcula limicola]|uniref:Halobacterial output domain-containing protein n=1 Tax=Haloarcula limicola TaxID=1429915 RepID=A0A8J7Y5M5_9EURY|nr:HalOD1 output domain-containing protein [Halomicroarcula limicola]MBV0924707.1 hypothetical protein [Halomicroarcula limicola]